jgi:hypothetical protein
MKISRKLLKIIKEMIKEEIAKLNNLGPITNNNYVKNPKILI